MKIYLTVDNPLGGRSYADHDIGWLRDEIEDMGGKIDAEATPKQVAETWARLRGYKLLRVYADLGDRLLYL